MPDKEILKKQIIYRSIHRGTKEMDLLLGEFVKKNINSFNLNELKELEYLVDTEDTILEKWYFNKITTKQIPVNKVSKLLKIFKI
jgi:antitoxin CptB|tara:strand:- start:300 stop:554 length:255 start_codon:yes stop_codon:yes gene_type:complete